MLFSENSYPLNFKYLHKISQYNFISLLFKYNKGCNSIILLLSFLSFSIILLDKFSADISLSLFL